MTNNLKRRTTEHRSGKGGRFSSRYHLKQLVYYESFYDIRKAIKREKQLKRWHRLTGRGYGETQLVNHCSNGVQCPDEVHEQNRRSEFIITKR